MKVLLLGSKGQLGLEFSKYLANKKIQFFPYDIGDCNVADFNILKQKIEEHQPNLIINCTAYNFVDKAEDEPDLAFAFNSIGPVNLSILAKMNNIKLIHYSSDYVFDGSKNEMYIEQDTTNPLNLYGHSKLLGENNIINNCDDYLIFRTSWVYGSGSKNSFAYKLTQWSKENTQLKIVDDEISVPTSVNTLVQVTMNAIDAELKGLYHLTNSGSCSRFELAKELKKILNLEVDIQSAKAIDFNFKANRPLFSAMSNELLSKELNIEIPNWKEEINNFYKNNKLI